MIVSKSCCRQNGKADLILCVLSFLLESSTFRLSFILHIYIFIYFFLMHLFFIDGQRGGKGEMYG